MVAVRHTGAEREDRQPAQQLPKPICGEQHADGLRAQVQRPVHEHHVEHAQRTHAQQRHEGDDDQRREQPRPAHIAQPVAHLGEHRGASFPDSFRTRRGNSGEQRHCHHVDRYKHQHQPVRTKSRIEHRGQARRGDQHQAVEQLHQAVGSPKRILPHDSWCRRVRRGHQELCCGIHQQGCKQDNRDAGLVMD